MERVMKNRLEEHKRLQYCLMYFLVEQTVTSKKGEQPIDPQLFSFRLNIFETSYKILCTPLSSFPQSFALFLLRCGVFRGSAPISHL